MIVRHFTCAEHPEYGELGWRPSWIPHFDPSTGFTLAHDILEHMPRDAGTVETEFVAMGAIIWLRGGSGWFQEHRPHNADIAYHMSGDFQLQAEYLNGRMLRAAPATRPLTEDWAEDVIQRCVQQGDQAIRDESDDRAEQLIALLDPIHITNYLRAGYRSAARRYRGRDPYDIAVIFDEITKIAERELECADEGMEMKLSIDLSLPKGW